MPCTGVFFTQSLQSCVLYTCVRARDDRGPTPTPTHTRRRAPAPASARLRIEARHGRRGQRRAGGAAHGPRAQPSGPRPRPGRRRCWRTGKSLLLTQIKRTSGARCNPSPTSVPTHAHSPRRRALPRSNRGHQYRLSSLKQMSHSSPLHSVEGAQPSQESCVVLWKRRVGLDTSGEFKASHRTNAKARYDHAVPSEVELRPVD